MTVDDSCVLYLCSVYEQLLTSRGELHTHGKPTQVILIILLVYRLFDRHLWNSSLRPITPLSFLLEHISLISSVTSRNVEHSFSCLQPEQNINKLKRKNTCCCAGILLILHICWIVSLPNYVETHCLFTLLTPYQSCIKLLCYCCYIYIYKNTGRLLLQSQEMQCIIHKG